MVKFMTFGILMVLLFIGLPCLEAQSPMAAPMTSPGVPIAQAPATDCVTALTNVSDCLTYVQVGSNLTVPDKNCCPEFAGLLESNPICLCELIGQATNYGVDLNKALKLPGACKVETPPLDACPGGSPASAPTPSSTSAPGSTTAGPGPASADTGGVGLAPAGSGNGSNGASGTTIHDLSTIICLAVAIFIAYYF